MSEYAIFYKMGKSLALPFNYTVLPENTDMDDMCMVFYFIINFYYYVCHLLYFIKLVTRRNLSINCEKNWREKNQTHVKTCVNVNDDYAIEKIEGMRTRKPTTKLHYMLHTRYQQNENRLTYTQTQSHLHYKP